MIPLEVEEIGQLQRGSRKLSKDLMFFLHYIIFVFV
jgi:hypothetical protein